MRAGATLDVLVAGAGVVGVAVARALAARGREVVVVEAEPVAGAHASSRNSEVVHAGLYHAPGSLKARLCVAGRSLLYAYAEHAGIPHARLGKLVLATREEELAALGELRERALENGVAGVTLLDTREVRELEPAVRAAGALWSPESGIVDSHALLAALTRDAKRAGATFAFRTPLLGGRCEDGALELELGGSEPCRVRARTFVNAAGLYAPAVARTLAGVDARAIPTPYFALGHYFLLAGPSPFRHLVYPLPVPGGLGVHVTLDLAGRARFGPDVSYVESVDYRFDESRAGSFYAAVRTYFPALADGALRPGHTGIRAKLGPAGTSHDFVIQGPRETGAEGYVALYGIESPGLTASLAIAEHVCTLVEA